VKWEKVNATLPKGMEPEDVTLEQALELVAAKAGTKGRKKAAPRAKTAAKAKSPGKSKTATKAAARTEATKKTASRRKASG
jgi:DNA topoisomerase I